MKARIDVENEVGRTQRTEGIIYERKYPLCILVTKIGKVKIDGVEITDYKSLPFAIYDLKEKKFYGYVKEEGTFLFKSRYIEEKILEIIKKHKITNIFKDTSYVYLHNRIKVSVSFHTRAATIDPENYSSLEEYKKAREKAIADIKELGIIPHTFSRYFREKEEIEMDFNYNDGCIVHKKSGEILSLPSKWITDENIDMWKAYQKAKGQDYVWVELARTSAYQHIREKIEEYKKEIGELNQSLQKPAEERLKYYDGYAEWGYGSAREIEAERIDENTIRLRYADIIFGDCGGSVTYSNGRSQSGSSVAFEDKDWIIIENAPYPVIVIKPDKRFENDAYAQDKYNYMVVDANLYHEREIKDRIKQLKYRIDKLQESLSCR